jgi:hypothetical protein
VIAYFDTRKPKENSADVISYNEYKTEGDPKKPKRHVVRK